LQEILIAFECMLREMRGRCMVAAIVSLGGRGVHTVDGLEVVERCRGSHGVDVSSLCYSWMR
jgi:hypothetical protein